MLYTIISEQEIFPSTQPDGNNKFCEIAGGILEYREGAQNSVVRLHSTNPRMYLKPEFAPDSTVDWQKIGVRKEAQK